MNDERILYVRARQLLGTGKLPRRRPDRVWGGSSFGGSRCALCEILIRYDEVALEIEFNDGAASDSNHRLHTRCFLALEPMLHDSDPGSAAGPHAEAGSERAAPRLSSVAPTTKIPPYVRGDAPFGGSS